MKIRDAKGPELGDVTGLYYQLYPDRDKAPLAKMTGPEFKSKVLVAKEGKETVGFALATFTSYAKSRFGYIEELIVDKNHRGRGIGSRLIKRALAWEKVLGAEVVFVTTDNETAFYKKMGFRPGKKNTWLLWTPK